MTRYVLSDSAAADIEALLDFIAAESGINQATHVLDHLALAFERLAAFPKIGSVRPLLTPDFVRWWPVRSLLIVYDDRASPLVILRVIHGARDLRTLDTGLS